MVNINERSISKAIKNQESIFKGDLESWLYTKRKVRQGAISEEDSKIIFNYWANNASRPTGDKNNVVKKHIGKKEYVHHSKHVLEKTQTEAFLEFQQLHPEVKVKQRTFESLKSFFVKQATERDRRSSLCLKHMETKIVFDACMKFCKATGKASVNGDEYPVLKTLTEAAENTLCPKEDGKMFYNIKCLERECESCGVDALPLLPEETSTEGSVHWSHYDYVSTGKFFSNGQEKRK